MTWFITIYFFNFKIENLTKVEGNYWSKTIMYCIVLCLRPQMIKQNLKFKKGLDNWYKSLWTFLVNWFLSILIKFFNYFFNLNLWLLFYLKLIELSFIIYKNSIYNDVHSNTKYYLSASDLLANPVKAKRTHQEIQQSLIKSIKI